MGLSFIPHEPIILRCHVIIDEQDVFAWWEYEPVQSLDADQKVRWTREEAGIAQDNLSSAFVGSPKDRLQLGAILYNAL